MTLTPMDSANPLSTWEALPLGCLRYDPASQEEEKTQKWYTRGTALSGMKILADFDKLISEQTGNTRLMCVIIINMAYHPKRNF